MDVGDIQVRLRQFAADRDWEQYHSPKNLTVALAVEAAELMEIFQWVTPEESNNVANNPKVYSQLHAELADVLIYALVDNGGNAPGSTGTELGQIILWDDGNTGR